MPVPQGALDVVSFGAEQLPQNVKAFYLKQEFDQKQVIHLPLNNPRPQELSKALFVTVQIEASTQVQHGPALPRVQGSGYLVHGVQQLPGGRGHREV